MRARFVLAAVIGCLLSFSFAVEAQAQNKCPLLLKPAQERYSEALRTSLKTHIEYEKAADMINFDRGIGFAADWMNSLAHVAQLYFKLESNAFAEGNDFEQYVAGRGMALDEFYRTMEGMTFGGLRTPFSIELWHMQDALLEYAEDEMQNVELADDFGPLFKTRYQNLLALKKELESIASGDYRGSRMLSVSDIIKFREFLMMYVDAELAAIAPFAKP